MHTSYATAEKSLCGASYLHMIPWRCDNSNSGGECLAVCRLLRAVEAHPMSVHIRAMSSIAALYYVRDCLSRV